MPLGSLAYGPTMGEKKVALITGASRGLGRTLAGFLTDLGYDLVLTARRETLLCEAAEELTLRGARVRALPGDVADPAHRERLAAEVRAFGRLDLLVNNASELGPSPLPPLADIPLDALERVLSVNLVAPVGLVQQTLELLRRSRGLVVNISSDAAVGGYPGWGAYGSSKAALDLASRTLAAELHNVEIGVVSVDPGDLRTEMHQAAFPGEDISDRPPPDATIPFWAWLVGRDPLEVTGMRYEAQGERWEAAS